MTKRSTWHPIVPGPASVADECEAFLTGDYADYVGERGWTVPAWAYLNQLAHARPDALRALGRVRRPRSRRYDWASLERELAAVIAGGRSDDEVRALQRGVLVPLELDLAAHGRNTMTALELAHRTAVALSS